MPSTSTILKSFCVGTIELNVSSSMESKGDRELSVALLVQLLVVELVHLFFKETEGEKPPTDFTFIDISLYKIEKQDYKS